MILFRFIFSTATKADEIALPIYRNISSMSTDVGKIEKVEILLKKGRKLCQDEIQIQDKRDDYSEAWKAVQGNLE